MGRTAVACDLCRDKKRKCDGQRPICESCRTYGLLCGYGRVIHSKRGKYWDQKYVQSLENQVRILSTSAGIGRNDGNDESAGTVKYGGAEMENSNHHRSPKALNDFTSLVWPISPGSNDEPLFVGPGFFNIPFGKSLPAFETPDLQPPSEAAVTIVQIAQDTELKEHLKQIFLETINPYYNFVEESWLQFSGLFPENDPALQFLYSAVFGIAAHCSPRTMHGEAECLIDYAESLVLECCRDHPCISVLRGLLIMSCYKHAILESSQGLVYNYMAIGLSSTLHVGQIHRLPAERAKPLDNIAREASVRTLWSLLFVNGYGTPALGASFRMFWDVSETPSYLSTLPADVTNTTAVAFESHCKLVCIQQDRLDPIYSPKFQTLSWAEKEGLFLRAYTALNSFRQTIDPCLLLTRTSRPHRTQIVLWVSYHAACISLHRRYLNPVGLQSTARSQSSLHDITTAATEITRLLQKLAVLGELAMVPSFLAYHTLRAALVHALNLTDEKGELGREAKRGLRTCFSTLKTLRDHSWPTISHHILCFLQSTLASWGLKVYMGTEVPRRI